VGDSKGGMAIFDLDKTLTVRSSYTPFILFVARRRPLRFLHAPRLLFLGLMLLLGLRHRDDVKAEMWRAVLGGLDRTATEAMGADFAKHWAEAALRQNAKTVIDRHKSAGDRLVLATAAVDLVAAPFGKALGFDDIVATRSAWTRDGKLAAEFDGLNCYGDEKLRRVQMLLGDTAPEHSTAYSDHVTDLPLLTWAAHGVAVNPHAALAEVVSDHGLQVEDWDA